MAKILARTTDGPLYIIRSTDNLNLFYDSRKGKMRERAFATVYDEEQRAFTRLGKDEEWFCIGIVDAETLKGSSGK